MINVFSPGNEPYVAAVPAPSLTLTEQLNLCLSVLLDVLKVLVLSVPIFIKSLKKVFIPPAKKSIRGWTALVTGGAHGIGKAIATELSREGCNIVIADIDGKAGEIVAQELREQYNIKAISYEIDVANYKVLPKLKEYIEDKIGPVDILVNNAGIMPLLSIREGSEEDIERYVAINITSHFYTVRVFLSGMIKRRRGHIVSLSSMSALYPIPGAVIYSATKYAVTGFTRALEQEIREEDNGTSIYFTSVHPYFVASRKDLIDCLNLRIPAISPEETGKKTVEAILRNYRTVVIPGWFLGLVRFMNVLPYEVQNVIRDQIFKEKETRLIKYPESHDM